jgi:hypothetical protein
LTRLVLDTSNGFKFELQGGTSAPVAAGFDAPGPIDPPSEPFVEPALHRKHRDRALSTVPPDRRAGRRRVLFGANVEKNAYRNPLWVFLNNRPVRQQRDSLNERHGHSRNKFLCAEIR